MAVWRNTGASCDAVSLLGLTLRRLFAIVVFWSGMQHFNPKMFLLVNRINRKA